MAGNALEIGTAYVALVPSAEGIASKIAQELGGPAADAGDKAGDQAGKGFAGKLLGHVQGLGGGKMAALIGGLGAAGLVGLGSSIASAFDEGFDTIRLKTGQTGDALKGLQDDMKSVMKEIPTSAADAGTAIGELNQKLGLTGQPLQDLATQVLELSRVTETDLGANVEAVTGVFNNWGIATADQGPKLDELFRASQATGTSVTDLANIMGQSGSVLRQAGLSFEDSAALLGTLSKNGVDAASVMPSLSKAVATAAKDGKNAGDVLKDTFAAIRNAPDDTSAAAAAMDTFGAKAGPQLAGLVRQGKLSFEELSASIAAGGDTIVGVGQDTADLPEKLEILKNKALVAFEPLASKGLEAATTLAEKLTPAIGFLTDHLNIVGPIIAGVVAALLTYKVVTTAISTATQVAAVATKVWSAAQAAFNFVMAANPVVLVVAAIIALGAAIYLAYQKFEPFRAVVDAVFGALRNFVTGAIDFVIDHWQLLLAILTGPIGAAVILLITHFNTIKDAVLGMVSWVGDRIADFVNFFVELPGKIISAVGDFAGLLISKGTDLIQGLINGYLSILDTVTGFFTNLGGTIINWIGDAASFLFNKGRDIIQGLQNGISNFFESVFRGWFKIGDWIKDAVGDAASFLYDIGGDIVNGLVNGIKNAWHRVTDTISDLTGGLSGIAKKVLGIGSPSKVFAEIGVNTMQGFQVGIENEFKNVSGSLNSKMNDLAGIGANLAGSVDIGSSGTVSQTAGLSGATFNNVFNQVGADPTAITREISWLALTQRG